MILWTIQSAAAWHAFQREKTLRAHSQFVEPAFRAAYEWMVGQMVKQIGPHPKTVRYPLWAWYQWRNHRKRRPDLRGGAHLPAGQRGVRIEFEQPDAAALLSDFDLWHYVLNDWYLPASMAEGEAFERELSDRGLSPYGTGPSTDAAYHRRIAQSWERIFDVAWAAEGIADPYPMKSIQATLWQVNLDQVRAVTFFTAR